MKWNEIDFMWKPKELEKDGIKLKQKLVDLGTLLQTLSFESLDKVLY